MTMNENMHFHRVKINSSHLMCMRNVPVMHEKCPCTHHSHEICCNLAQTKSQIHSSLVY